MVSLIATDLDGTFLGADSMPSAENTEAVLAAADAGVHIVFATGRPYRWLAVLDPFRPVHPTLLASNGAVSVNAATGEILHDIAMSPTTVAGIITDVRNVLPQALFCTEEATQWFADEGFDRWKIGGPPDGEGPIENFLGADRRIVKLLVRVFDFPSDKLFNVVNPIVGDRGTTTFSAIMTDGLVEISAPGVSKGMALAQVCQDHGIDPSDAAAFGDMPNDLTMLELVGHPYIVSGAHPTLRDCGFPIIGNHDDSAVGRQIQALLTPSTTVGRAGLEPATQGL
ncbi:HAD hydrolase family protein [Cutibacterium sp.]|uniref:HAD hydrolase family protein n=1 Tax=Cutibacterium sp. TaxID=1912221 RepID=UPI0026DD4F2B|nr:HAD hydrolase family protein [Cutibacterium sp.]MDO4411786.1 HAD hydrolase family protein [Cutibacterium sp.]